MGVHAKKLPREASKCPLSSFPHHVNAATWCKWPQEAFKCLLSLLSSNCCICMMWKLTQEAFKCLPSALLHRHEPHQLVCETGKIMEVHHLWEPMNFQPSQTASFLICTYPYWWQNRNKWKTTHNLIKLKSTFLPQYSYLRAQWLHYHMPSKLHASGKQAVSSDVDERWTIWFPLNHSMWRGLACPQFISAQPK